MGSPRHILILLQRPGSACGTGGTVELCSKSKTPIFVGVQNCKREAGEER